MGPSDRTHRKVNAVAPSTEPTVAPKKVDAVAAHASFGNAFVGRALEGEEGTLGQSIVARIARDAKGIGASPEEEAEREALKSIPSGGGEKLPDDVRLRMEAAFGHDFDNVRVHVS